MQVTIRDFASQDSTDSGTIAHTSNCPRLGTLENTRATFPMMDIADFTYDVDTADDAVNQFFALDTQHESVEMCPCVD